MKYNFQELEKKWQKNWSDNQLYKTDIDHNKPKYYVLDMFPYPSGAGLHVGHPLGYIASDIYARLKRLEGYNVLHPMGYDSFGLPAEQYAIQTGQHPAKTIKENTDKYRQQLDQLGLSFDWSREFKTSSPSYYKWTQDVFGKLFNHWYCLRDNKAKPISELVQEFEENGNCQIQASHSSNKTFSAKEWCNYNQQEKEKALLDYRLAYLADTYVNWCPQLKTVLANDEVQNGFSIRGNHPVSQKKMKQWFLRISAYADRLLKGLEKLEWSDSIKEIQKNWIGKSTGASIHFSIKNSSEKIEIFTTRADTIFGATYMVLAPENELVSKITTNAEKNGVNQYLDKVLAKTERERMQAKELTGVFTGAYAINPFNNKEVPIWISEYVLQSYGTGSIMAVPAHDERDWNFAQKFSLPIMSIIEGIEVENGCHDSKTSVVKNSDFLNGLNVPAAIEKMYEELLKRGIGKKVINYRLRDAIFSRQRYWGEPFPVYYKEGLPYLLKDNELPLELPEVDQYLPTDEGDPPLGRAKNWTSKEGHPLELSTMPGFAGSSAYFLRFMDPHNDKELVSKEANHYWENVDLYVGGSEHATGHLLYSRFWNMFLFDLGLIKKEEPFKRLINQGMIQGRSQFVYRIQGKNTFVSAGLKDKYTTQQIHIDISLVHNDQLDIEKFKQWRNEYAEAEFILEEGKYICGHAIEKMSKSLFNVVNPDQIVEDYGADTLRLYEMFLGPLSASKPWITNGISGVHKFLHKLWALYHDGGEFNVSKESPSPQELKVLHTLIKKVRDDYQNLSFNTTVSAFMICVNDLTALKCQKREILEPIITLLSPFAPHIAEELWHKLGHYTSVTKSQLPSHDDKFLIEDTYTYPVSFNGKTRLTMDLSLDLSKDDLQSEVLKSEKVKKYLDGKEIKKIIIVPKKIINFVLGK